MAQRPAGGVNEGHRTRPPAPPGRCSGERCVELQQRLDAQGLELAGKPRRRAGRVVARRAEPGTRLRPGTDLDADLLRRTATQAERERALGAASVAIERPLTMISKARRRVPPATLQWMRMLRALTQACGPAGASVGTRVGASSRFVSTVHEMVAREVATWPSASVCRTATECGPLARPASFRALRSRRCRPRRRRCTGTWRRALRRRRSSPEVCRVTAGGGDADARRGRGSGIHRPRRRGGRTTGARGVDAAHGDGLRAVGQAGSGGGRGARGVGAPSRLHS